VPTKVFSSRRDLLRSKDKTDLFPTGSDTRPKIQFDTMLSGDIGEEQN